MIAKVRRREISLAAAWLTVDEVDVEIEKVG